MASLRLSIGDSNDDIDIKNYITLCDNFIFVDRDEFDRCGNLGSITFSQLRDLCRKNKLSYPLFFANHAKILQLVETYNADLYGKIDEKKILTIGSRGGDLDIRRIRWIVADVIEKQKIYKQYGYNTDLRDEKIVKYLKNTQKSVEEQAAYVCHKLDLSHNKLHNECRTKNDAFKYLAAQLSSQHIHVFREVRNAMPQNIPSGLNISGIYIRDNYNPAIFIGNELSLYPDEGVGRKIYTMIFLLVSIFKDYSFAVSINHSSAKMDNATKKKLSEIHRITNEILMPKEHLGTTSFADIKDIEMTANTLKVSPTALVVRLAKLGLLRKDVEDSMKEELTKKYTDYIRAKRAEDKRRREAGQGTGPPLGRIYKSYHGDFIDFVRLNVPDAQRRAIFDSRISYGRSYAKYEDIYA